MLRVPALSRALTSSLVAAIVVAAAGSAFASDAGPGPDAGPIDAGDVASRSATSSTALDAELDRLRKEVVDLRALRDRAALQHFPVASLFETDLLDDAAVARRIERLRQQVAGAVRSSSTSVDVGIVVQAGARERDALQVERDRLRLEFLERPREERQAAIDRDRARRRLSDEHDRAEREHAAAREAERDSELARQKALESARVAQTATKRAFASELARVAAERSTIASVRSDLAEQRQRELAVESERQAAVADLAQRATAPEISPRDADAAYDEIVRLLREQREALRVALGRLDERIVSRSDFRLEIDLGAGEYAALASERERLTAEISALEQEAATLEEHERERRYAAAATLVAEMQSLNDLRIFLLEKVSVEKRNDVLGLTRAGIAQLERELTHLEITARWYPRAKLRAVDRIPSLLEDTFAVGRLSLDAIATLLLLAVALVVRRNHRVWIDRTRGFALGFVRRRALRLWLDRWSLALAAVSGPLLLLGIVYAFFDGVLEAEDGPELDVLRDIAVAFAWYRLAIAFVHHTLTTAAIREVGSVSNEVGEKILRSIRIGGRFVFVLYAFLIISSAVLGKGYLYRLVVAFAWVGALPIGYLLLRWWRADIANAYLRFRPSGSLAVLVARTRDRPTGIFIALAAFAFVAARGATIYLRQTLLGFEQTRKALAFFFRRRLERQREAGSDVVESAESLPEPLARAFGEGPTDSEWAIDHYPRLDTIADWLRDYRKGSRGGAAVALVGEQGVGKTSWLEALARASSPPLEIHTIEQRLTTERELCAMVSRILSVEAAATGGELVGRLAAGGRRVVLLDLVHNLVLRAVGGMEAYRAFATIVSSTRDQIFWVCAFAKRPFELVRRVEVGRDVFDDVVELSPWSEGDIGALIDRRMNAIGFVASYEDLIVDRLEGTEFTSEVVRTAGSFRRLLWDYADGNPRVAVHFWLRSLVPEAERRVRVRLFAAPKADELEQLGERTRFVLAALVQHENITADEAQRFLRYPLFECAAALSFLAQRGYLVENTGRYRLTTRWYRAISRFLRRKNLLFT